MGRGDGPLPRQLRLDFFANGLLRSLSAADSKENIMLRDDRYLVFLALFLTRVRVGNPRKDRTGMLRGWGESSFGEGHCVLSVGWNRNPGH